MSKNQDSENIVLGDDIFTFRPINDGLGFHNKASIKEEGISSVANLSPNKKSDKLKMSTQSPTEITSKSQKKISKSSDLKASLKVDSGRDEKIILPKSLLQVDFKYKLVFLISSLIAFHLAGLFLIANHYSVSSLFWYQERYTSIGLFLLIISHYCIFISLVLKSSSGKNMAS